MTNYKFWALLTLIVVLWGLSSSGFAEDIVYKGQMRCAPIPGSTGELVVGIAMTARDGAVAYQRPIIALDGRTVLGQESGTGRIGPDGAVMLQGGASTSLSTFTVQYIGRSSGSHIDLSGTQAHTAPRQFNRSCTIAVDRG